MPPDPAYTLESMGSKHLPPQQNVLPLEDHVLQADRQIKRMSLGILFIPVLSSSYTIYTFFHFFFSALFYYFFLINFSLPLSFISLPFISSLYFSLYYVWERKSG